MNYKFFMLASFITVNCHAVALTESDFISLRDPFHTVTPTTQLINFSQASIAQLTLLGCLTFGEQHYAFIASSAGELVWITVGDVVGSEKAVVIEIAAEKIVLKEQEKSYTKFWEIKKP